MGEMVPIGSPSGESRPPVPLDSESSAGLSSGMCSLLLLLLEEDMLAEGSGFSSSIAF